MISALARTSVRTIGRTCMPATGCMPSRTFQTTRNTAFNEEFPGARNGVPYTELPSNKKRPLSPHVSIYAFPTIALSSITNRVTGVMLCVGVYGIGSLSLLGVDCSSIMMDLGQTSIAPVFKFGVAFPLTYHYICGIRHVIWDKYVMGFNNDAMNQSSLLVVGSSLALSGIAACL